LVREGDWEGERYTASLFSISLFHQAEKEKKRIRREEKGGEKLFTFFTTLVAEEKRGGERSRTPLSLEVKGEGGKERGVGRGKKNRRGQPLNVFISFTLEMGWGGGEKE